jgi:hypothetical protein
MNRLAQYITIGPEDWSPIYEINEKQSPSYEEDWTPNEPRIPLVSLFDATSWNGVSSNSASHRRRVNLTGGVHTETAHESPSASITVTMAPHIGHLHSASSVLGNYLNEIYSLPVVKRAQLFEALNSIDAQLSDLDFNEDGQIVILTQENGLDCFYAICTKEGDFRGTWLPDGSLMRRSWSANPPSDYLAMSLI